VMHRNSNGLAYIARTTLFQHIIKSVPLIPYLLLR
jgi:hypothetical protein